MVSYVIGVDFGTESGRAVVIDARDGRELGSSVYPYANGVIDEALPAPDDDHTDTYTGTLTGTETQALAHAWVLRTLGISAAAVSGAQ